MVSLIRFAFFLQLYLITPFVIHAQLSDLTFRHINRSSGLPVDEITALAQDSTGFIWIGTVEGVFRYDGYNFKKDKYSDEKDHLVNAVSKIYVDKKNKLWVGTIDAGITSMETNGRILQTFSSQTTSLATPLADYVTDIGEDTDGNMWWTTIDGLFRLSADKKNLRCFKSETTHARGNSFSSLFIDKSGVIWLTGHQSLINFDPVKEQFYYAASPTIKKIPADRKYFSAIAFQGSRLWYSSWAPDLGMFDFSTDKNYLFYSGVGISTPNFNQLATDMYTDKKGATWMATGSGLHVSWPGAKGISATFRHNPENAFSLINDKVTAILEDKDGNFWFGTKRGISITQPYQQQIQNFSVNSIQTNPFGDMEVTDIIELDSNALLFGTQQGNGFYQTDSKFKVIRYVTFHTSDFDWAWTHWDDKKRRRVLISTQEGMLLYDKDKKSLEKSQDTIFQNFHPVSSFVETSDSILWMSRFWNKLLRYNLNTGKHKIYDLPLMGEKPQVLYLSKDNENGLWILGHGSGVLRWDERKEKIVERLITGNTSQSLRQNEIYFFKDIGAYFLIGYYTKGLSLYHKQKKIYEHLTTSNGLISNLVRAATLARDGSVWIATKNGISQFFPATKSFKNYSYENGILHNDFVSIEQLNDGRIVAGSTKGIVSFQPAKITDQHILPPPFVTDINIYGRHLQIDSFLNSGTPLKISYKENYFSFEYISLLYNKTQQIEYAYMLEGVDKDWRLAGNRRFVSYSNIPGGDYVFRLKARLADGHWVNSRENLKVSVNTPFYFTWWFYLGCAIVISLISYVIFKFRVAQILKLERMRTAISSDLHDEVGASLTSISLFSEIIRQPGGSPQKKEEYLERIGERSRESIEKMSDIIWSINPHNDNLQQMMLRMKNYATEVAELAEISVHWQENGNLSACRLNMEDRKNVYLFFKEAVNNAVKHSRAKNIYVYLATSGQQISISIKDDGKGFDHPHSSGGQGLKSLKRRADLLHGTFYINSLPGKGTDISLDFISINK